MYLYWFDICKLRFDCIANPFEDFNCKLLCLKRESNINYSEVNISFRILLASHLEFGILPLGVQFYHCVKAILE